MDKTSQENIHPVFVLGCLRSGTTLIGEFIATAPNLLNTGELSAMYFASNVAEIKHEGRRLEWIVLQMFR